MAKIPLGTTNGTKRSRVVMLAVAHVLGAGMAILAGMTSREPASEEAACDAACVEQTALATARRDGTKSAVATRGDLAESLRQCAALENSWVEPCANGAMMEHVALERQDGPFFKPGETGEGATGNDEKRTPTTNEVEMLCPEAPAATRAPCYQLVWSLLYERYGENVEGAMQVCERAVGGGERTACWRGFSTYAIELAEKRSNLAWPPKTPGEARKYAEAFLNECERLGDEAACIEGGSYTTYAGSYAAGLDETLTPPICERAGEFHEACQRGKKRAEAMIAAAK